MALFAKWKPHAKVLIHSYHTNEMRVLKREPSIAVPGTLEYHLEGQDCVINGHWLHVYEKPDDDDVGVSEWVSDYLQGLCKRPFHAPAQ